MTIDPSQDPTADPGWTGAVLWAVLGLLPGVGISLQKGRLRKGRIDGLTMLRSLFLSLTFALVPIGGVVAILANVSKIGSLRGGTPIAVIAIGIVVLGLVGQIGAAKLSSSLSSKTPAELAGAYRTRFFQRIAFADTAALLGFAGFITTGRWWMYPLGCVFSAAGFRRVVPTAGHLARDQDAIRATGSHVNLVAALRTAMPPPSSATWH